MTFRLSAALLLLGATSASVAATPRAGVDYELAPPPTVQSAPSAMKPPVTVVYYFSHYCGACAAMYTPVERWLAVLPADVTVLRAIVPILHQGGREPSNQTYQALLQMGVLPQVDPKLFSLLSRGKSVFADRQAMLSWLGKEGVSVETFENTAKSFSVATGTARAQSAVGRLMQLEQANIPVILIDDRYLVYFTAISEMERKIATLDALVTKARAERLAP